MAYKFSLSFDGELVLISDDSADELRQLNLIKTALKTKSKIGLDIGIKAGGSYWSSVFFLGNSLAGSLELSVKNNTLLIKGSVQFSIDKLPPKMGKALKANNYTIEVGGFSVDGEGLIAEKSLLINSPDLVIS